MLSVLSVLSPQAAQYCILKVQHGIPVFKGLIDGVLTAPLSGQGEYGSHDQKLTSPLVSLLYLL